MIVTLTKLSIIRIFLFSFICLFGLSSMSFKSENDTPWKCEDLKFTYQILVKGRYQVQLPTTICSDITKARKTNERVIITYSEYVSIEVFSEEETQVLDSTQKEIKYV